MRIRNNWIATNIEKQEVTDYKEGFEDWQGGIISIRAGYRYQGPRGLLLRIAPNLAYADNDIYLVPALSIGYSF